VFAAMGRFVSPLGCAPSDDAVGDGGIGATDLLVYVVVGWVNEEKGERRKKP